MWPSSTSSYASSSTSVASIDVEVRDVGAEQRLQLQPHLLVERDRRHRVVGLAPEVEVLARTAGGCRRDRRCAPRAKSSLSRSRSVSSACDVSDSSASRFWAMMSSIFPCEARVAGGVLLEEPAELGGVEVRGLQVLVHELPVALLPVTEEVTVEVARPPDAALEEPEVERREPLGDAAEEQAAGEGVVALREVPEVVAHEVRRQAAVGPAHRAAVAGDRDAEVDELLPHRVVVVGAVDARARRCRRAAWPGRAATRRRPRWCAGSCPPVTSTFRPERVRVLQLLDRLGRLGEAAARRPAPCGRGTARTGRRPSCCTRGSRRCSARDRRCRARG